jgi:hypothetical protein
MSIVPRQHPLSVEDHEPSAQVVPNFRQVLTGNARERRLDWREQSRTRAALKSREIQAMTIKWITKVKNYLAER